MGTLYDLNKERALRLVKKNTPREGLLPMGYADWVAAGMSAETLLERTRRHLEELGIQAIAMFGARKWSDMLDVERMMAQQAEEDGK